MELLPCLANSKQQNYTEGGRGTTTLLPFQTKNLLLNSNPTVLTYKNQVTFIQKSKGLTYNKRTLYNLKIHTSTKQHIASISDGCTGENDWRLSGRENVNQTVIHWLSKCYTLPILYVLRIIVLSPERSSSSPPHLCSLLYTQGLYLLPPLTLVRAPRILYWYFSSPEEAQRCLNHQG